MSIIVKFPQGEDVELEQGKPVVVLGANGSGKSLLMSIILKNCGFLFREILFHLRFQFFHKIYYHLLLAI